MDLTRKPQGSQQTGEYGILTVVKKAITHTYYCGNLNYKSI
jgi:hypothetical protein